MNNRFSELVALIMPVLGIVITIFADIEDTLTKGILIAILVLLAIAFAFISAFKGNKNISNTQVLDKSRRYTKHLVKIVKTNARVLAKDFNLTELAETKKKINVVTKKINRSYANHRQIELDKLIKEKNALLDKYYDQSHGYADAELLEVNKPIKKMVALANFEAPALVGCNQSAVEKY